jgi:hypothetical protein
LDIKKKEKIKKRRLAKIIVGDLDEPKRKESKQLLKVVE